MTHSPHLHRRPGCAIMPSTRAYISQNILFRAPENGILTRRALSSFPALPSQIRGCAAFQGACLFCAEMKVCVLSRSLGLARQRRRPAVSGNADSRRGSRDRRKNKITRVEGAPLHAACTVTRVLRSALQTLTWTRDRADTRAHPEVRGGER